MHNHSITKTNFKRFWISTLILFLVVTVFIVSVIIKVDYSSTIPEEKQCAEKAYFNLQNHVKNVDKSRLREEFPYKIYLDSADYCNISSIQNHLNILYAVNPDSRQNQKILVDALTDKLEERINSRFKKYNPDSLILMLQWVSKFKYYKDLDTNNAKFYRMVHRHWYNYVANKLGQYNDENPYLKYHFKFKYLVSTCRAQSYPPDIRSSNTAKIIDNVVNSRWAYLLKRFWDGTGLLAKLLTAAVVLFTFYSYYCVYKLKFKKNTK